MSQLIPFRRGTFVRDFLDYKRVEGLSSKTCDAYQRTLTDFLLSLSHPGAVRLVKAAEIGAYLSKCNSRGLSSNSIASRVSRLREFFRYLQTERGLRNDPMLRIQAPKQTKVLPKFLSRDEARQLVEQEPSHSGSINSAALNLRDRAIVELLYSGGIRNSELRQLCCLDLRLKDRQLMVHGKGSKDRLVPFGMPAAAALAAYITEGRPLLRDATASPYLFLRGAWGSGPLSRGAVYSIVRRQGDAAGIPRVYPHKMRHSCATHMLEGHADLRSIQQILGHASIETTEIYTHVSQVHLREQVKLHPRAHPEKHGRAQLPQGYSKCSECLNVAETGKTLCVYHRQRANEAWRRYRERLRNQSTAQECPERRRGTAGLVE